MNINFKKLLFAACLSPLFPVIASAQDGGVAFTQGMTWQQVKQKARAEHKYIFADCYATWCGPCKMMDQHVYPNDTVGQAINQDFIAVKVQMDTSKKDDEATKGWYADAHAIMVDYKIGAFPTYLFFSPDGEIVHRGLGYLGPHHFMQLAADARDAHKQYYTLAAAFRAGDRDTATMRYLIMAAKTFRDKDLGSAVAGSYVHDYLDKLSDEEICTKPNLDFVGNVAGAVTFKDKVFQCLFRKPAMADSVEHDPEFANRWVNYMVNKEVIRPATDKAKAAGKEPDWTAIGKQVKHKFGAAYVEKNIVGAKVGWYHGEKNYKEYAKYLVIEKQSEDWQHLHNDVFSLFFLNNAAWDVFQYSDDKAELRAAEAWSEKVVELDPKSGADLDTKANLLYKLGQKEEAISLETKAVELEPKNKDIVAALEKMKRGEATWPAADSTGH